MTLGAKVPPCLCSWMLPHCPPRGSGGGRGQVCFRPSPVPQPTLTSQPGGWYPSPVLTTWRAISAAAIAPSSARAAKGAAATGAAAQETEELLRQRESVTLRARPSLVGGGAREGPPHCCSNPNLFSIAHPLGVGCGEGTDWPRCLPLGRAQFQFSQQPQPRPP